MTTPAPVTPRPTAMQIYDPASNRMVPVEQMLFKSPEEQARAIVRHFELTMPSCPSDAYIRTAEALVQQIIEGPELPDAVN